MPAKRPTKAELAETAAQERRAAAVAAAVAIGLQAIAVDGTEYSVADAPILPLEAVLERKARRRR